MDASSPTFPVPRDRIRSLLPPANVGCICALVPGDAIVPPRSRHDRDARPEHRPLDWYEPYSPRMPRACMRLFWAARSRDEAATAWAGRLLMRFQQRTLCACCGPHSCLTVAALFLEVALSISPCT